MKITKFKHKKVNKDGTFGKERIGSVNVKGGIIMSQKNGGCTIPSCGCSKGHWISISLPITKNGTVEGVAIQFDNEIEMNKFFKERVLNCNHL